MNVLPPARVRRERTIRLTASPDDVFPMLCPVREVEWASDWDPYAVYSESGVAEEGCVFITRHEGAESIWVITVHDAQNHRVEMLKITPGLTSAELEFAVEPDGDGSKMHVAYTHTALSKEGRDFVAAFDEEHWAGFMQEMESELNHYLGMGDSPDAGGPRYE